MSNRGKYFFRPGRYQQVNDMDNTIEEIHVIGLGQACVDCLGVAPVYPAENSKTELIDLEFLCGGPASTALVTLSRLGIATAFLGSLSDDFFGKKIIANLEDENVDISRLKITPGYTSQFAFIAISRDSGKRTILWHRGSVPHLSPEDADISMFPDARVLHLDGLMIKASLEASRQARNLGLTVVLDGGTMREETGQLLSFVDILIASEKFALPLVGDKASTISALYALRELGPSQVVITLGERGSIGLNDRGTFREDAFPVTAADTTGAGDVYHGAYIYGTLQGWEMDTCMRFASAAASLKCESIGAQTGIPDLKAVFKRLKP